MDVEFELTEEDYIAFTRFCRGRLRRSARLGRVNANQVRAAIFGLLGAGIILGWLAAYLPSKGVKSFFDGFSWFAAGIAIHWLFVTWLSSPKRQAKRLLHAGRNQRYLHHERIVLTPDALLSSSVFGSCTTPWPALAGIESTPDHGFFLTSTHTGLVVPRRAFLTNEEFVAFVEQARQYHAAIPYETWGATHLKTGSDQITAERKTSEQIQG